MFDSSLLNPMLTGDQLNEALRILPNYDDTIRVRDKPTRLVALSDIYNIYLPSKMSEEIYSKLYLSLIRAMNKKCSIKAVRQSNENYKAIRQMSHQGVIGGADSFSIIGCSGIGKTTAICRSIDLINGNPYLEYNETKIIPVLSVQCPFDSSVKGLSLEILRKIDAVLQTKYYSNAVRSHATIDILIGIISQVAFNHIGLLIIDEIQNVASSKNGKVFIHSLTQLINNSGVSICLVGTPECTPFFQQKIQLARRSMGLYYQPLEYNDFFADFCKIVFQYQYTQQKSVLSDGIIAWLYEHSGGLVSAVVSLLHDAQEIAIINGSEKLDLNTLNDAYKKRTAMLHSFINDGIKKLPQTSKSTKKEGRAISKNNVVINQWQSLSISEIVKQAKKSCCDVVGVLNQYITIEETDTGEKKKC